VKAQLWMSAFCVAAVAMAGDNPALLLNAPKSELPSLSLSLSEKAKNVPFDPSAAQPDPIVTWIHHQGPTRPSQFVSRMPVVVPRSDPDNMPIVPPNPSIDFKMIVKKPAVKSVP
jgi:hypothetical protein